MSSLQKRVECVLNLWFLCSEDAGSCDKHNVPAGFELGMEVARSLAHQPLRPVPVRRVADAPAGSDGNAAEAELIAMGDENQERVYPRLALVIYSTHIA